MDVERLAARLGVVQIRLVQFLNAEACLLPGSGPRTILVNDRSSRTRRRFSIAHELGHILLNGTGVKFRTDNSANNHEEGLSDAIAAELLMPSNIFVPAAVGMEPSLHTIARLADMFDTGVETTAIQYGGIVKSSGIGIAGWAPIKHVMRRRWATSRLPVSMMTERPLYDMTFGPSIAYDSAKTVTTFEYSKGKSGSLDTICHSKSYGSGSHKFVLSLTQMDTSKGGA